MDLFLIRHGETDENAADIIQGWLDTNLNERGLAQSKETAAAFNEAIDAIYSSDLKRATQTARLFRDKYPHVPYIEDQRLRERGFGDATGKHRSGYDWVSFWDPSDTISIPNAETLREYTARVRSFLDSIKRTNYSKALVVTHSGTINRIQEAMMLADFKHAEHINGKIVHIVLE